MIGTLEKPQSEMAKEATTPRLDPPEDMAKAIAATCTSPIWAQLVTMRVEQLTRHGHTPDADDIEPVMCLPRRARERLDLAVEGLSLGGWDQLKIARPRLLKSAALIIAAIESIDRRLAAKEGSSSQ